MNISDSEEVDYGSTPEDERVAQIVRQEKVPAKQSVAAQQGKQAAEQPKKGQAQGNTAEPESEPSVDPEEEAKPPKPAIKIEPVVLPARADTHVGNQKVRAALPTALDMQIDVFGQPAESLEQSRFAVLIREMAVSEVTFTTDPQNIVQTTNNKDPASAVVSRADAKGFEISADRRQYLHNQVGLWNESMDPRALCATVRYVVDLCEKSGCAVSCLAKWKLDRKAAKDEARPWPYVPLAIVPGESVEEYLIAFVVSFFNPKRAKDNPEVRSNTKTVAQWTNRLANFAEHRWNVVSNAQRQASFQPVTRACVVNVALMLRALRAPKAPYRVLPRPEVDEDGIPVRPECTVFRQGGDRKRGRSLVATERNQRVRVEPLGPVSAHGLAQSAAVASAWGRAAARSPSRGRQSPRTPPADEAAVMRFSLDRAELQIRDLEFQVHDLWKENAQLHDRLKDYPMPQQLIQFRDDYKATAKELAETKSQLGRAWARMKTLEATVEELKKSKDSTDAKNP
ncbi:unnamed protein product [Aphanomyces euteiches]